MAPARASIGYPWILNAIRKYNRETIILKPAPAQVVEFLQMPDRTEECQYPGAVVNISDRQYYIRAIITREAHEALERESEHFTLAHIKNKIVILKNCSLSFHPNEDGRRCEFYVTIQHFCILPMEIDTVDLLNCNVEPGVKKKIEGLWQVYMTELQKNDTMSDMDSSDISLTQLLIAESEQRLSELKSRAERCLDLDSFSTQEIAPQARTIWSAEMRNNKNKDNNFSVPVNALLISPEEEQALEQMSEFCPDVSSTSDADNTEGSDSSEQYVSAVSSVSQEPIDDACSSQQAVSDPSVGHQCNKNDPLQDRDSDSSQSQAEAFLLDLSIQPSQQIQPEANTSTTEQYVSAVPSVSQESIACSRNPWNNLKSICVSGSGAVSDPSAREQGSKNDPAANLDITPEILHLQDDSLGDSSQSQDEAFLLDLSMLPSQQIHPEANTSTTEQYVSAVPSVSQEPIDDACSSQQGNPWNNLDSICVSESGAEQYVSAVPAVSQEPIDDACSSQQVSDPSGGQQGSKNDPAADLDITPEILHLQDNALSNSSQSQAEASPVDLSILPSHQIQPDANTSTSINPTEASGALGSNADLCSQRRLSDCSQSLLGSIPLAQDSNQVHTFPQKPLTLESRVPISPISSKGKCDSRTFRNSCTESSGRKKNGSSRESKTMKRKQAPQDLDSILSDQGEHATVDNERPSCSSAVLSSTANHGAQTETERRGNTTNDSCMDKKQTRTEQVNKSARTKPAVDCTIPLRQKRLPHKPCLEFVSKPNTNSEKALPAAGVPTTRRTASTHPTSVCHRQNFPSLFLEMKKTKMTHRDGTPFQYMYKPPSADLSSRVNAVRIPTDLHEWSTKICSEAKEMDLQVLSGGPFS